MQTNFDSIDEELNERRSDPVAADVNQLGSSRHLAVKLGDQGNSTSSSFFNAKAKKQNNDVDLL